MKGYLIFFFESHYKNIINININKIQSIVDSTNNSQVLYNSYNVSIVIKPNTSNNPILLYKNNSKKNFIFKLYLLQRLLINDKQIVPIMPIIKTIPIG